MLTWWLSQVSVKNGCHSSELATRKSCQFSLLTSESGLSLCWAKSTHRKGRTSHCTQSLPTCPLLVKAAPSTRPHLHQATTNNKLTTKPLCCPQYTHCKGHHTELLRSAERLRFLIPLFMLGSQGLCLICSSTSRASAYLSQVGFCVTAGNLEGVLRVKFPGSCFLPSSLIQQTHLPILPSFCLGTGSQKIQ